MQLKAMVKNKARESGVLAQLALQNYMLVLELWRNGLSGSCEMHKVRDYSWKLKRIAWRRR